ncbi:MAG: hypothetical protein RLY93_00510 [Sumerlaeia bacterium]
MSKKKQRRKKSTGSGQSRSKRALYLRIGINSLVIGFLGFIVAVAVVSGAEEESTRLLVGQALEIITSAAIIAGMVLMVMGFITTAEADVDQVKGRH